MRTVTFTPLAGLGDNYLQVSLLLHWAATQEEEVAVICLHDDYVPPPERRAMSAVYVQKDLLDLLAPQPRIRFLYLPGRHPYPYGPEIHRFTPEIVFNQNLIPRYWPLDSEKFAPVPRPERPYLVCAFDSVSWPEQKRFTDTERQELLEHYRRGGYQIVDVGGPRRLAEKAYLIAHSAGYVGGDCGMVHLSAGIGKETHAYLPGPLIEPFVWYVKTMVHNGVKYQGDTRRNGFRYFDLSR